MTTTLKLIKRRPWLPISIHIFSNKAFLAFGHSIGMSYFRFQFFLENYTINVRWNIVSLSLVVATHMFLQLKLLYRNNFKSLQIIFTQMIATIPSILFWFENPSKWLTFNKRIVAGKYCKAIASVVYLIGVTKTCEWFLVIVVQTCYEFMNHNYFNDAHYSINFI